MARIFVSGANGFVGRALCASLTQQGHHVIAGVRRRKPGQSIDCASVCETGPLELQTNLQRHLAGVDAVIHAAGWSGNPKRATADQHRTDPAATHQLSKAASRAGVQHFILISSVKAIGAQTRGQPYDEFTPARPIDRYGVTKLQSEQALTDIKGIAKTIIRLPAIYGPGMKGGMLTLFALASRHVPLPLKGHHNERDFLSLTSMSDFVAACIARPPDTSEAKRTFLVCDGRSVSSAELYDLIAGMLHRRSFQFAIPEALLRAAAASKFNALQSLFGSLRVNDAWSRAQLQWTPPVDFEQALRVTASWHLKQTGKQAH